MGAVNLATEESWLAAKKIVRHFEAKFNEVEIVEAFKTIQVIVSESLRRLLERRARELRRLNNTDVPGPPAPGALP